MPTRPTNLSSPGFRSARLSLSAVTLLAAGAVQPAAGQERCPDLPAPTIVADQPGSFLQYWLVPDEPWLNEAMLPASTALREFRERIAATIDTDPRRLLERQVVQTQLGGGDVANVRLALSGGAGSIRPMSCLEGLLMAAQAERTRAQNSSMYDNPTEFAAHILRRGDTLKVWYYTVDQPGVRGLGTLNTPVEEDVRSGWTAVWSIHNHNFFPETDQVYGGVVPSTTDVEFARNMRTSLGDPRWVVTNGFDSIEITGEELDRFNGP